MLNTFVVYVENKPGVLTRVASLFRRRAFNIDSLTVGRTEKPEVSRMTIVVDADHDQALRVEANLYKLVNVLFVENITGKSSISRDLAMVKVSATHGTRSHVLELANVFRARVVDVGPESLTIEITGPEAKIDGILEVCAHTGSSKWCEPALWPCAAAPQKWTKLRRQQLRKPDPEPPPRTIAFLTRCNRRDFPRPVAWISLLFFLD